MSADIVVESSTQKVVVDPVANSITIEKAGPQGPPGPNIIPPGGTTGQVLAKLSDDDYDIGWVTP
ncbi:hypothetical protein KC887_07275 [Candidatus Kaiserbacteria bacterium]|nr:hypothetical protein [Candidatus Kaiserbacteria bacterium]